ncbi:hypothetical protein FOL47_002556 [Perkinsus chesapeaki]|uniref:Deoxyribodipyrimidine photo-lyase n=1 Tax=Perkinsus chesapeaki TaxID=330153 RepID=A0A7J6MDD6_PERCH|nr:hypothetical protein FOL47_002556 [Perkinsus chesapeaki]
MPAIPVVHQGRVRCLHSPPDCPDQPTGAVIYWMSREIRSKDNWALLYAQSLALKGKQPLVVVYNLTIGYLGGALRQHAFKVAGLRVVAKNLKDKGIAFRVDYADDFPARLADIAKNLQASHVVTDFTPLRVSKEWEESFKKEAQRLKIKFDQVDAHNVVPCWVASDKQEYAARTIRPRLWRHWDTYATDYPQVERHPYPYGGEGFEVTEDSEFDRLLNDEALLGHLDHTVKPVSWLVAGEDAGLEHLHNFVKCMKGYNKKRNDPTKDATSDLSPYFHYGMISPQRAVMEVSRATSVPKPDRDAFVEEAFIRRELADNFCYYNQNYDSFEGFHSWAQKTLNDHAKDKRKYLYDLETLEKALTHDELWNACQNEMMKHGKMQGYLRMYWGKKILEWTASPRQALQFAIYLNDKYELDGRDPNGYVGCAWSIGGVHDQGWAERPIFGKIRYMTYDGCKRKFDVQAYVKKWGGIGEEGRASSGGIKAFFKPLKTTSKRAAEDPSAASKRPRLCMSLKNIGDEIAALQDYMVSRFDILEEKMDKLTSNVDSLRDQLRTLQKRRPAAAHVADEDETIFYPLSASFLEATVVHNSSTAEDDNSNADVDAEDHEASPAVSCRSTASHTELCTGKVTGTRGRAKKAIGGVRGKANPSPMNEGKRDSFMSTFSHSRDGPKTPLTRAAVSNIRTPMTSTTAKKKRRMEVEPIYLVEMDLTVRHKGRDLCDLKGFSFWPKGLLSSQLLQKLRKDAKIRHLLDQSEGLSFQGVTADGEVIALDEGAAGSSARGYEKLIVTL